MERISKAIDKLKNLTNLHNLKNRDAIKTSSFISGAIAGLIAGPLSKRVANAVIFGSIAAYASTLINIDRGVDKS